MELAVSNPDDSGDIIPGMHLKPMSRGRHWKNHLGLSATFWLIFISFSAIQNIQSSLNTEDGTGLISLCVLYGTTLATGIFSPLIIYATGTKWSISFGALFFCFYSYGNIFRSSYLIMAASAFAGLATAPLWVSQGTYVTRAAYQLSAISGRPGELVINRMHGIFHFIYSSTHISGNLILFFILSDPDAPEIDRNTSSCGANNCGTSLGSSALPPSKGTADLLFGVFTGLGMVAVLVCIFCVDDQQVLKSSKVGGKRVSPLLGNICRLMKDARIVLLTPMFVYAGMQLAFFYGDFTKAYVACSQGMSSVGLVLASYGASLALFSFIFGQLEKVTDRIFRFIFGCLAHLGLLCFMMFWRPVQGADLSLFIIAIAWGMCAAVWRSQVMSLVGAMFPDDQESAFTIWNLGECLGFLVGFLLSTFNGLCVSHRLIILAGCLIVSFCFYLICEHNDRNKERRGIKFRECPTMETKL